MVEYLSECFGNEILSNAYDFPKGTPVYLKSGYMLELFSWNDDSFIMITPKESGTRLPTLKKHFYQIQERLGMQCALNLEWLTPLQRNNLIKDKIPFVSGTNQVYLPFWGCIFKDKYQQKKVVSPKMTPTTQLVFLWTYYAICNNQRVNLSTAVDKLDIPKTSISRAFIELSEYGVIEQVQDGTTKWIKLLDGPIVSLNKAMPFLNSPVSKTIYIKEIPSNIDYKIGGLRALPAISTSQRDGCIVLDKETANNLPKDLLISKRDFDDFGGIVAEVWKYSPQKLLPNGVVDELSLLLSLRDIEDERVQKELDDIREKYGLEV